MTEENIVRAAEQLSSPWISIKGDHHNLKHGGEKLK